MTFLYIWGIFGIVTALFYGFCLNVTVVGKQVLEETPAVKLIGMVIFLILGGFVTFLVMLFSVLSGVLRGYKQMKGDDD